MVATTEESRVEIARRCAHVNASGKPCGGYAIHESTFCFAHDPTRTAERAEARRRGGRAGRLAFFPECDLAIRSIDDVVRLVETPVNAVLTGHVDTRIANSIGVLANVALRAIQQGDLERRLEALESVLEPNRSRSVAARRRG